MKINYTLDPENRIAGFTSYPFSDALPSLNYPDDFPEGDPTEYRMIDGNLIYDPVDRSAEIAENKRNEAAYRLMYTESIASAESFDDAKALEYKDLFDLWKPDTAYRQGDRRLYADTLYKCLQGHTSQTGWEPPGVPALWVEVSLDEWPLIPNPITSTGAWMKDQKGKTADGRKWVSLIDNNVWQPTDYPAGWAGVKA